MASHLEVARRWAQDNGARPLKGFNVWSRDRTIYSYGEHFPIARFTEDAGGRRVVLFTDRGYSVSTAKHKSYVWRALGYGRRVPVFVVPNLWPSAAAHADNYTAILARASECVQKALRARTHSAMHNRDADALRLMAAQYAEAFNLNLSELAA